MRCCSLIIFIFPFIAFAAAKSAGDFFDLSVQFRAEVKKEKSFAKKQAKLQQLKTSLQTSKKESEAKNPHEGDTAEDQVTFLYLTFQPLFKMADASKNECAKTRHQITLEDRMGRGENAVLTADAKEALEWLKILCQ
jgi:hypothetical protein